MQTLLIPNPVPRHITLTEPFLEFLRNSETIDYDDGQYYNTNFQEAFGNFPDLSGYDVHPTNNFDIFRIRFTGDSDEEEERLNELRQIEEERAHRIRVAQEQEAALEERRRREQSSIEERNAAQKLRIENAFSVLKELAPVEVNMKNIPDDISTVTFEGISVFVMTADPNFQQEIRKVHQIGRIIDARYNTRLDDPVSYLINRDTKTVIAEVIPTPKGIAVRTFESYNSMNENYIRRSAQTIKRSLEHYEFSKPKEEESIDERVLTEYARATYNNKAQKISALNAEYTNLYQTAYHHWQNQLQCETEVRNIENSDLVARLRAQYEAEKSKIRALIKRWKEVPMVKSISNKEIRGDNRMVTSVMITPSEDFPVTEIQIANNGNPDAYPLHFNFIGLPRDHILSGACTEPQILSQYMRAIRPDGNIGVFLKNLTRIIKNPERLLE